MSLIHNLTELEKLTNTKLFLEEIQLQQKEMKNCIQNVSESLKYLANKFLITNSIENGDIISSVKNNMSVLEKKIKTILRH